MAIRIECGFDFATIGTASVEITDNSGTFDLIFSAAGISTTNAGVYNTATEYSHVAWTGSDYNHVKLSSQLSGALNAESTDSYTVARNSAHGYTITNLSNTSSMIFTGDEGDRMRGILGFQGNEVAAVSLVSDAITWYSIPAAFPCWSGDSGQYDEEGKTEGAYAQGGPTYMVSVTSAAQRREFRFALESQAKTFIEYAAANAPWTFEDFFAHAGQPNPFAVVKDSGTYLFELHHDGTSFSKRGRSRGSANYDGLWHINFQCWAKGKL